jgi:predicted permease
MLYQLLHVVVPTFMVIAVGLCWSKLGQRYDTEMVTTLVMNISGPCLVFATLSSLDISPSLLGRIGAATLAAVILSVLFGSLVLRIAGLHLRDFLSPLVFPNCGNMGLPVCLFAYGNTGLAMAIIIFAVYVAGQFTIGLGLYSGEVSPLALIKDPLIWAVIVSIFFLIMGLKPYEIILRTTGLLGDLTIPLMLFTLGVSLARLRVLKITRPLLLSILRFGMGLGIGIIVSAMFGLTGTARGIFILQNTMPVAVFNYLLAERYKRNAGETAEWLVTSTILSLLTLPLVLHYLK